MHNTVTIRATARRLRSRQARESLAGKVVTCPMLHRVAAQAGTVPLHPEFAALPPGDPNNHL